MFFLFLFFGTFFLLTTYSNAVSFKSAWFLQLNPLTSLCVMIAARSMVWPLLIGSALVFTLTLIFGRFFCGFICPLGTLIDASDKYLFGHTPPFKAQVLPSKLIRVKYLLLIALGVLALFSSLVPLFFDPISLLTRIATIILVPLFSIVRADSTAFLQQISSGALSFPAFKVPLYYAIGEALILVALIFFGALWAPRFYCRVLCPSGAFFGIVGRFALFHRRSHAATCHSCGLCAKLCPTNAIINKNGDTTIQSECIVCGVCTSKKHVACNRFVFGKPSLAFVKGPDLSRRSLVAGAGIGALLVPLVRADALVKQDGQGRLIRPPGAIEEIDFVKKCIGCGACYKVCPTNAIQPCTFLDGALRQFSPKIVPRIGGCEEKCFACGHVCPTGALRPLVYESKKYAKIGTAVIHRQKCLAWSQKRECLVCDETCPYNAIEASVQETTKGPFKVPIVYESLCTGCGMCEMHCPIKGDGAIVVYKFGENRLSKGEYLTQWQKKSFDEQRQKSDSKGMMGTASSSSADTPLTGFENTGFVSQSSGSELVDTAKFAPQNTKSTSSGSALPAGFE